MEGLAAEEGLTVGDATTASTVGGAKVRRGSARAGECSEHARPSWSRAYLVVAIQHR